MRTANKVEGFSHLADRNLEAKLLIKCHCQIRVKTSESKTWASQGWADLGQLPALLLSPNAPPPAESHCAGLPRLWAALTFSMAHVQHLDTKQST